MLTVEICLGTSCHLMGTQDLMAVIDSLPFEQRSSIEVKGIACLKNCGNGPSIKINGTLLIRATPEILLEALQSSL